MGKTKTYHHGDLRAALLQAARKKLLKHGYEMLSLRELARDIGVARSAPYFHFENREALLSALIAQGAAEQENFYKKASSAPGSASDRLAIACRAYLDFARENKELFRLMFASPVKLDPAYDKDIRRTQELFDHLVANVMAAGHEDEVNGVAIACWSAMHGVAMLRLHGRLGHLIEASTFEELAIEAVLKLAGAR